MPRMGKLGPIAGDRPDCRCAAGDRIDTSVGGKRMSGTLKRVVVVAVLLLAATTVVVRTTGSVPAFGHSARNNSASAASKSSPSFKASVGAYKLSFQAAKGTVSITKAGSRAVLQIRELGGIKKLDLLYSTKKVRSSGNTWTLTGKANWASFNLKISSLPIPNQASSGAAFLGLVLAINATKAAPGFPAPEMRIASAPSGSLKLYADSPPIAGNNLFLSSAALASSFLYYSDYTALGTYFDRTRSGVTQSIFSYPRAGSKGSLVGVHGNSFGYVPPDSSLNDLPRHKTTTVTSSYLYLSPGIPSTESEASTGYLQMLDAVT